MYSRRKVIGVMGSGTDPSAHLARPLGELVARAGCHLLTGGGGGVMAEAGRAFCAVRDRAGLAIGVIRSHDFPRPDPRTGERRYRPAAVNEWVELPIYTHLPLSSEAVESRNHVNVLTADVLVALPGRAGTLSEVRLRLQYGRPVIVFLGDPADGLTIGGKSAWELAAEDPEKVSIAEDIGEVESLIEGCV